jgi:hypothetical protein
MIELIYEMLKITTVDTEEIRILKGKYEIPLTLKQGFKNRKLWLKK